MNIDVLVGTANDKNYLASRFNFSPHLFLVSSPLAAADQILAKIGPNGKVGRLRIFSLSALFPPSQLVRLRDLFEADGSVEIFTSPRNSGGLGQSGLTSGGPGGTNPVGGFSGGGFNGFSGAIGADLKAQSLHLASLLKVPVLLMDL